MTFANLNNKRAHKERAISFWHLGREITSRACEEIEKQGGKLRPSQRNALNFFLGEAKKEYDNAIREMRSSL